MTDQILKFELKTRSFIFILMVVFLELVTCSRLQNFSDVHVKPVSKTLLFENEDFIITNAFVTKPKKKFSEDLDDDEQGSGSIDFNVYQRISNYTTSIIPNRIENASGRHDYNTIRKFNCFIFY